jgi:hypothetical protein
LISLQVPQRKGQDPAADQREKALQRLATRGCVRLFNAIAKAQRQLREAEEATGSRVKAVKLGKASFLAQLKRSSGAEGSKQDQPLVPSAPARQAAAAAAGGRQQRQQQADDSSEDEDAVGWAVLQQGFVGVQSERWGGRGACWLNADVAGLRCWLVVCLAQCARVKASAAAYV